jgi:hypothetical protein
LTLSDNQMAAPKKCLRTSGLNAIMTSLPAAASNSDCRRCSHPDCRATRLAASVREREIAVNDPISSSVIANSTACRQLAMMQLLVSQPQTRNPRTRHRFLDRFHGIGRLDWLDGGAFVPGINQMLQPTELFVPQSGKRMPRGWDDTDEARMGKECGAIIEDSLNAALVKWWLVHVSGANIPNWDLACEALYHGDEHAVVLAEAKAHVKEFTDGAAGQSGENADNRMRIAAAIDEARAGLSRHDPGVKISSERWYQFSNRVAFAWKLASNGIPTALIYLGFIGDKGISSDPFRDRDHWRDTVLNSTRDIFPASMWERPLDINGTPLWLLIRSLPCLRQSHITALR